MSNNKYKKYQKIILFAINITIWVLLVGAFIFTWLNYYHVDLAKTRRFVKRGHYLIFALYGIVLFLFTQVYGGYKVGYYRKTDVMFSATLAMLFTNILTYLQISLLLYRLADARPMIILSLVDFVFLVIWSFSANSIYFKLYPPHQILMIYEGKQMSKDLVYKMSKRSEKYNIIKAINIDYGLDEINKEIPNYDAVLISDVNSSIRNKIVKLCYHNNICIYTTPKISDIIIRGAKEITLFDTPILMTEAFGLSFEQSLAKRIMDIIISIIGIIISLPFMIITAIAIKLEDRGPILYKQDRLTLNGKVFQVYKFRSMIIDAEKENGAVLAKKGDERITKVGKIIRKIRFDELPQLFNIFSGDMSVVGPRPERPEIAKEYEESMEEFSYRLKVKAGLTGYAQVIGKYNTTPYDKLKMDLMYINNYSLLMDIKLILMTVKILFVSESTEGINEDQTTAQR